MIPVCDVRKQYESLKGEIDSALLQAAADGQYILGSNVKSFEKEVAEWLGSPYAAGVANGTDALHLALRALDIGPGDEVITTPFTFIATAEAASLVGAKPVFVDIDPKTFNMDPSRIEQAVTSRTKAIIPVHLFGQPCDMDAIMEIARARGLRVVEDCAQAMGATYQGRQVGTFGDFGCFSFFPSKNLGCMGDGGLVTASDRGLYERVETLRRHGGRVRYYHESVGMNSRLDDLQAAVLRVKLKHLEKWNTDRRRNAYRYNHLLAGLPNVVTPFELTASDGRQCPRDFSETAVAGSNGRLRSVYHQYTLLIDRRDAAIEALKSDGVAAMIYYPVPLHLQTVYQTLGYHTGDFPNTEMVASRCMSLPMFPELTDQQQLTITESIRRFCLDAASSGRKAA